VRIKNLNKIKVAELFYSLQGEGHYIGTPSIFLRTFGCNFQCAGFSMPRGELSQERLNIDPTKYEKYEDLPLVHTGCDSYASWDSRFKHLSKFMTIDEIVEKIKELLPEGKFSTTKHLVITGGEPLLGWQKAYPELLWILQKECNLSHITFETNGTQELTEELQNLRRHFNITYSVSSKLPSSGEQWEKAIKPEIVNQYYYNSMLTYLKWVVSSKDDLNDIFRAIDEYSKQVPMITIFLMPAGGTTLHYNENEQWVADLCMRNGWRYSPRLQVQLWKNAWGT
jgi:7-carboxy-7-deazaguanine synthase